MQKKYILNSGGRTTPRLLTDKFQIVIFFLLTGRAGIPADKYIYIWKS